MIELSQIAADVLLESLQRSNVPPHKGLRIRQENHGVTLDLDSPKGNDRVIRYSSSVVLIIDLNTEAEIGNARIDVEMNSNEPYVALYRRATDNL